LLAPSDQSILAFDIMDLAHLFNNVTNIAFLVVVFFLTIGSERVKTWLEKNTDNRFKRSVDKNGRVNVLLNEVRGIYDADRVLLYQLHNGQYYFGGDGAEKLSLTNYVLAPGIAMPSDSKISHLTSHLPHLLSTMSDKGYVHLTLDQITDPAYQQVLAADGVCDVIMGPIKDRQGLWKGVLVLCYRSPCVEIDFKVVGEYSLKLGDLLKA
jgi:hypothetical protein